MSAPNATQPSMLSGHAQYAKGYVEETVGKAIGSKDWEESGKKDTLEGINEMKTEEELPSHVPRGRQTLTKPNKAANAARTGEPAASGLGGKVEEMAGRAAGCEGMEKEGLVRQEKAAVNGSEGVEREGEGLVKQDQPAK